MTATPAQLAALGSQGVDWDAIAAELDTSGSALLAQLLSADECTALVGAYADETRYRKTVVMERHGYGRGEYRYFAYPLPERVQQLRSALYPHLVPVANRWNEALGVATRYPSDHASYLERCHASGQRRPTPLLLRYRPGDYNCLHQDLYGEEHFPLQVAVLLSRPQHDFSGGEFVLTEQRPRMQSRADVVPLQQGDAVIFAVNERPLRGARGWHRLKMRHGVSRVRSGQRHTLGIIFHDAA
jgi:hypothetical protein